MPKRNFELEDETSRMFDYYLSHSQVDANQLINKLIKNYLVENLSSKQCQLARQHKGKDSFSAEKVLSNFGDMWTQD